MPNFTEWATDDQDWDRETGNPGLGQFANAVQVWSCCQSDPNAVSVADAARSFNVTPQQMIEAVEWHPWMFLSGPHDDFAKLMIEHEGE